MFNDVTCYMPEHRDQPAKVLCSNANDLGDDGDFWRESVTSLTTVKRRMLLLNQIYLKTSDVSNAKIKIPKRVIHVDLLDLPVM